MTLKVPVPCYLGVKLPRDPQPGKAGWTAGSRAGQTQQAGCIVHKPGASTALFPQLCPDSWAVDPVISVWAEDRRGSVLGPQVVSRSEQWHGAQKQSTDHTCPGYHLGAPGPGPLPRTFPTNAARGPQPAVDSAEGKVGGTGAGRETKAFSPFPQQFPFCLPRNTEGCCPLFPQVQEPKAWFTTYLLPTWAVSLPEHRDGTVAILGVHKGPRFECRSLLPHSASTEAGARVQGPSPGSRGPKRTIHTPLSCTCTSLALSPQ